MLATSVPLWRPEHPEKNQEGQWKTLETPRNCSLVWQHKGKPQHQGTEDQGQAEPNKKKNLMSRTVKERKHILSEYRLSTVSIVFKYGLDWSAVWFGLVPSTVRFRYPLGWQRIREPHAKQYLDSTQNQRRFWGRGCDEALFSEKKGVWKGGRQFSEWGAW